MKLVLSKMVKSTIVNLGRIMEYLRRGKGIFDSALTRANEVSAQKSLPEFKKGEYYGNDLKVELTDQLANPDIEKVTGYYQRINDPKAAMRFGTDNLDEYSFWAWRSCGVANVLSILKSYGLYEGNLFDLVKEIDNNGGYLHKDKWGRKDIGWKHDALKEAMTSRGVHAEVVARVGINRLLKNLLDKKIAIASIRSRGNIGSHMVIVTGFTWDEKYPILEIYDPYNLDKQGGHKKMKLDDFEHIFLNKGLMVWTD